MDVMSCIVTALTLLFLNGMIKWSVLLHVNLFYRYGREDLEVFGLNFRRDLVDVSVDVLLHWIM